MGILRSIGIRLVSGLRGIRSGQRGALVVGAGGWAASASESGAKEFCSGEQRT
jgi:hypothetical protein